MLPGVNPNADLWNIAATHQPFLLDHCLRSTQYTYSHTQTLTHPPPTPAPARSMENVCWNIRTMWMSSYLLVAVGHWLQVVCPSQFWAATRNRKSTNDAAKDIIYNFHPRCTSLLPPLVCLCHVSNEDHLTVVRHHLTLPPMLNYIKKVHQGGSPVYQFHCWITSQNTDHRSTGLDWEALTYGCPKRSLILTRR